MKTRERQEMHVTVVGCSTGAEVYSLCDVLKSMLGEDSVKVSAIDICGKAIDIGRAGRFADFGAECQGVDSDIVARLFEKTGDTVVVRADLREGISWIVADAGDSGLAEAVGPQDLVFANNFLIHEEPGKAELMLANVARLVKRGGFLCVTGVDINLRARLLPKLGFRPVDECIVDIHEGDRMLRSGWPWEYWGLEPLDDSRKDWRLRYASVFRREDGLCD